jgi:hypothetical protein
VTTIDTAITAADTDLTTKINGGVSQILGGQDTQFIEDSLANCLGHPDLYTPAAFGGKLEKVQLLMSTGLGQLRSIGITPTVAQSFYNAALTSIAQHNYPMAWGKFCTAYQHMLVRGNGTLLSP